jgi:hypothetical protein
MGARVQCYSGGLYAEKPVALTWEGERKRIVKIANCKRLPEGRFFLVITDDRSVFELLYREDHDEWQIKHLGEEPA